MRQLVVDNSTLTPGDLAGIDHYFPVNDSTYGGPWHTGDMLYDRAESWYTDEMFLAPRRFFYEHGASLQPMWAYYFTQFIPGTSPALGGACMRLLVLMRSLNGWTVYHASELFFIFGPVPDPAQTEFADQITEYWINFVHDMVPDRTSTRRVFALCSYPLFSFFFPANWPRYDTSSRHVMQLMRNNITLIPDGK